MRKILLTHPHKVIHLPAPVGFGTTKRLGFSCLTSIPLMPRIWQFFLTKEWCCSSVEDGKRVSYERVLGWTVSRKGIEF